MALPDLDTADISWIGYWNFLDNGGSSIDPIEATSAMASYEEYTNGVQGTYTIASHTLGVRVKDDGWIVAWMDRQTEEAIQVSSRPVGVHDIAYGWWSSGGATGINTTMVSQAVQDLKTDLSNEAEATFYHPDVGLYNYMAEDATTLSLFSVHLGSASLTPSSGTALWWGWSMGVTAENSNYYANADYATSQENIQLADNGSWPEYGNREIVDSGLITPGEQINVTSNAEYRDAKVDVLLAWS